MHDNKAPTRVRIWDLPTRIFHWALALGVVALGVTGTVGSFNAMVWHFRLGYAVLALLLFRVLWGLVGGRWSRFGAFIYSPRAVIDYLQGKGEPADAAGHSPIGAWSVFAMLALLLAQVASGLVSDDEGSTGPLSRFVSNSAVSLASNYHANIGKWLLLALVLLHIAAIVYYLLRKNNLVGAMLHGDKEVVAAVPSSRDDAASRAGALLVFIGCGGAAYWISTLDVVAG